MYSAAQLVAAQAGESEALWLVERLLPAGGVSLLAGEVASGKTFLALDLAISAASGLTAWGGRACLKSKVLYCCLDSSPRTIRGRVQALCAGRGIAPPGDLFFDFSALNLAGPGGQARLGEMVRGGRFTLVVLDVLARYLPGVDENAVSAVGPVFSLLRALAATSGAAFLVVHHFNKSAAPRAGRMQRVRGSSDIAAAVDAALSVTLGGTREQPRRTVTPEKNRELPEEAPFDFSLESMVLAGGPALRLAFAAPSAQTASAAERAVWGQAEVMAMLRARWEEGDGAEGPRGLTRREIEAGLRARLPAGQRLSTFGMNQIFIALGETPGVRVTQAGRIKRYAWEGEGS